MGRGCQRHRGGEGSDLDVLFGIWYLVGKVVTWVIGQLISDVVFGILYLVFDNFYNLSIFFTFLTKKMAMTIQEICGL